MKKKRLDMHKLSLKRSTVAKFQSGGYWGFTNNGCNSFGPGEPCGPTDLCPPPTQIGCGPAPTQGCPPPPTGGCNPITIEAACPSHSICPRGIYCF